MFWADTIQKWTGECTGETSAGSNNTAFSVGWCVAQAVSGCALARVYIYYILLLHLQLKESYTSGLSKE